MTRSMIVRARRALGVATVLGAVLGSVYACAEKAFAPGAAGAGLVRLSILTAVSQQLSPVTRTIAIQVGYDRTSGAFVPLLTQAMPVTSGDAVQLSMSVDVSSCLSDPNRAATANVCPLLVLVWLKDATGATLDSSSQGPISATPGTAPSPVTVVVTAVASVAVAPAGPDPLATGATLQLTATPKDGSGNALAGRAIIWTSSAPAVATVSATGLVTAVTPGAATITATAGGVNGTAQITILVPVVSVAVTPSPDTLATGATLQLTATPTDAGGNALAGRAVTWASSAPSMASVSATGLVTGVAPGTVTITASAEGRTGGAALTVFDPCTLGRATFTIPGTFAGSLLSSDCMVNGKPRDSLQIVIPQQQTVLFTERSVGSPGLLYWGCLGFGYCYGQDSVGTPASFRVLYAPGTYSGYVNPQSAAGRGNYAIDATVVSDDYSNCADDVVVIMSGISTNQQITSTDCVSPILATARYDWFPMLMMAGTPYTFTMQATSEKWLEIWSSANVKMANAPYASSATLVFTPTSTGVYWVDVVASFPSTFGPYSLSVLPLVSGQSAGASVQHVRVPPP